MRRLIGATAVAAVVLVFAGSVAYGQSCAGDFDFNRQVTDADVPEGIAFLFGKFGDFGTFTPVLKGVADANGDGWLTVADIGASVVRLGTICGQTATPTRTSTPGTTPTPTPVASSTPPPSATPTGGGGGTGTPTRTPTATTSPTRTFTRPPTPTSTALACALPAASVGTINGALDETDCLVRVGNRERYADGFALVEPVAGTAVRIEVTSTAVTPYVLVRDPGGQFVAVEGPPPIEFVAMTTLPYEIFVASDPTTVPDTGEYALTISTRSCPAPLNLSLPQSGELTASDCPEPAGPSVADRVNPADQFFIDVTETEVPRNIRVQMTVLGGDVDPEFAIVGPDGYEVLYAAEDNLIIGESDVNEDARFLALQPGRYTVIASGLGGLGRYRVAQASQPQCRAKTLPPFVDGSRVQVAGTLSGATSGVGSTSCAAPLRPPSSDTDVPEPNSPADVYAFDANAGDVVSFLMTSDDDAYLFLVGPTDCSRAGAGCVPNRLLVSDDDGGEFGGSSAQLAATVVHRGTYLIVAANVGPLSPPEDGDPAEEIDYTLFTQRCAARGSLTVNGQIRSANFDAFSCRGSGGVPVASYSFDGVTGNFVAASVSAGTFDAFVRVLGPDGIVAGNDNDPFVPGTANALVGRLLSSTGTHFVEASASGAQTAPSLESPVAYGVGVQSCPLKAGSSGTVSGSLVADDCTFANGHRYDVFRFEGPSDPQALEVLSVAVPSGVCVAALIGSGMQVPVDQCTMGSLEVPLFPGRSGLVVAEANPGAGGSYALKVARCAATALGFGTESTGVLSGEDCAAANDAPAQWFLVRAPEGLVTFQSNGVLGEVTADFPLAARLTDAFGDFAPGSDGLFASDPELMYRLWADLGLMVRVQGVSASDTGGFRLRVSAGERRQ